MLVRAYFRLDQTVVISDWLSLRNMETHKTQQADARVKLRQDHALGSIA